MVFIPKKLLLTIIVMVILVGYFSSKIGFKKDNIIEEFSESIIENNFGVEVDLTPEDY